ncbi:DUF3192 domain-containing protein [Parashewanella curva]|uniref:DUF3192 domain-containing protein n=1 Tax=Parashewanella curva TaxID=2338552 RepID=A0A3L8PWG3_9GAMM|nr:DUF3192 domain-containing protein [Parashewanella curva]RLV59631.1 DUF3192 domain-containing protein [Parashewanella curva]
MKSKVPIIIGIGFAVYTVFVAIAVTNYEPTIADMDWEDRQAHNQGALTQLSLGQHIETVRSKLGAADFSEAKTSDDKKMLVLFYRTHHGKSDGKTTKDECTPLLFVDDHLVAWGPDTYKQYLDAKLTI